MDWLNLWPWAAFTLFVLVLLALDLGLFHRRAHAVSMREAAIWTGVWMALAGLFGAGVYLWLGAESALEFLTGYLIEQSLSVDNMFVFALLFAYFRVPAAYQHRVLFWGILGALAMRLAMIVVGAALIKAFHPVIYLFGGFLIFSGIKLALHRDAEVHPERNPVLTLFRRLVPVTPEYHGDRFWVRVGGRLAATPLMAVLVLVETTDLIFAIDSIPAIFAVTDDPFIVYTSNVFAILGLRSLYFLLAGMLDRFHYLRLGLAVVLGFVGVKMVLADLYPIPIGLSLAVIAAVLSAAVIASLRRARRLERTAPARRPAPESATRG